VVDRIHIAESIADRRNPPVEEESASRGALPLLAKPFQHTTTIIEEGLQQGPPAKTPNKCHGRERATRHYFKTSGKWEHIHQDRWWKTDKTGLQHFRKKRP